MGCLLQFIQVEDLHSSARSALLFVFFFSLRYNPDFGGKWHLNVRKEKRIINGGITQKKIPIQYLLKIIYKRS